MERGDTTSGRFVPEVVSSARAAHERSRVPHREAIHRKSYDICLVSPDPASGHEQQGTRPVLLVSSGPFNRLTRVPIVLPVTSGGTFARMAGFAVSLEGAGTGTTGVIRCDQPRALDLGARCGRRLETVPEIIMDDVLARLATLVA